MQPFSRCRRRLFPTIRYFRDGRCSPFLAFELRSFQTVSRLRGAARERQACRKHLSLIAAAHERRRAATPDTVAFLRVTSRSPQSHLYRRGDATPARREGLHLMSSLVGPRYESGFRSYLDTDSGSTLPYTVLRRCREAAGKSNEEATVDHETNFCSCM